jgi:hypothetical protein
LLQPVALNLSGSAATKSALPGLQSANGKELGRDTIKGAAIMGLVNLSVLTGVIQGNVDAQVSPATAVL